MVEKNGTSEMYPTMKKVTKVFDHFLDNPSRTLKEKWQLTKTFAEYVSDTAFELEEELEENG